jgi:cellulose synthase/poly-beta-1,6-N-acetylglucosamine synthase-like glycosyltransferase
MMVFYLGLGIYGAGMLFIFLYSLSQAHLLFHYFKSRKSKVSPKALEFTDLPLVTIQLPIYNEKYVAERLIDSIANVEYPHHLLEVQILDDSTDETKEILQNALLKYPEINFQYLYRNKRVGFKAGALAEGLLKAKGEMIAIFDADFIPDPKFLLKTLPYFSDHQVGMVQSRWTHLNKNYSWLTRLQAFALDAHFIVEQMGRNFQQAFINFNGTGGIWRRSCIEDAGGWSPDTLTEDLDLSYRAQQKGWKFVYDVSIHSPAELPPVMPAIKSQQFRWTKGGAECAAKHLKNVWKNDFPLKIKLHATAHLLNSSVFVAVFAVSLSSLLMAAISYLGQKDLAYFSYSAFFFSGFVVIAAVYYVANLISEKTSLVKSIQFFAHLILFLAVSMGLSLHNSIAVLEGWSGKKSPFVRTPKFNLIEHKNSPKENVYQAMGVPLTTYLELLLALLFTGAVVMGIYFQSFYFVFLHFMLALGFGIIGITSFIGYQGK